jgi:hypothetical protein
VSAAQAGARAREPRQPAAEAPVTIRAENGVDYRLQLDPVRVPPASPQNSFELDEALIPVLLWRSVPVLLLRHERIDVVERFVLEAAEGLDGVSAQEIAELTGLPRQAVQPLLRRLLSAGGLRRSDQGLYLPLEATRLVLERESVAVEEDGVEDFAYFPDTDELLVLADITARERDKIFHHRMRPVLWKPVDDRLHGLARHQIVNRHLEAGTARRCPDGLVRAQDAGDGPILQEGTGELCPAYLARRVTCRFEREHWTVALTLHGSATDRRAGGESPQSAPYKVTTRFAELDALCSRWAALVHGVCHPDALAALWRAVAPPGAKTAVPAGLLVEERDPARFAMKLTRPAAVVLTGRDVPLTEPAGVQIRAEEARFRVVVEFGPAEGDDGAAELFAVDHAAVHLAEDPALGPETAVRLAAAQFGLSRPPDWIRVRERMWRLKMYEAIYRMREHDDFSYS